MSSNQPLPSLQQEGFAQDIVAGLNQTDAYRKNYNTDNASPETVYVNASHLANDTKVSPRIQHLRDQQQATVAQKRAWDLDRYVAATELNLEKSIEFKQMGPANTALSMIGEATGVIVKQTTPQTQVNAVIILAQNATMEELRQAAGLLGPATVPEALDAAQDTEDGVVEADGA